MNNNKNANSKPKKPPNKGQKNNTVKPSAEPPSTRKKQIKQNTEDTRKR